MIFPTPVGVFPSWREFSNYKINIPHACGGVSKLAGTLSIYTHIPHAFNGRLDTFLALLGTLDDLALILVIE